ncbi:hypothetical protein BU24DRAFT_423664 [Aaosphaeria arxii CBS 175.79]|uniref:Uncharacterized protein n=1 Tax=Aaosphaeria arxii CBS 175.79 TaxID=1450172 RepID=A0A6A5XNP3_9PLEO|nr:uncharacterized protein BU24DRAFT_423664 [Aaosphaeria arxii CBS 175.79]KAF2014762.1 hypothetical protein BU24DRAFT_423664 [Aaosphaeria arxii CBS 175.79]
MFAARAVERDEGPTFASCSPRNGAVSLKTRAGALDWLRRSSLLWLFYLSHAHCGPEASQTLPKRCIDRFSLASCMPSNLTWGARSSFGPIMRRSGGSVCGAPTRTYYGRHESLLHY